ncbi:MAG: DNA-processing protein DprA [Clostridia bacterium]|nr:DNA-processing protein DprA [Clostridia bacterium]
MVSQFEILFKKHPIKTIKYDDPSFPQNFKELKDCPKEIYLIGNENLLNKDAISIVGTRHSSSYGNELSYDFANTLSKNGFVIVSGLAYGIDQSAHNGAIEFGNTIAIIAGGFYSSFSSTNYKIIKKILDFGGAIITEYKKDVAPKAFTFLARNRLIAAFSLATIVIEAPLKSGALCTAMHAYELNKTLYAIPWSLNYSKGTGCNKLLKNMAIPLIDVNQILLKFKNIQISLLNQKNKNDFNIPKEYEPIYSFIKECGPLSSEQIYDKFKTLNISTISSALTIMEINSLINYKDNLFYI